MERFLLLLLLIFTAFDLITLVLNRIFKNKIIKYIPGLISLLTAIYYIYLSRAANQGLADIGFVLVSIMLFTGFLGTIITGFYLDIIRPKLRK